MTRSIALISEHASPLATLGGVDAGGQNVYVAHLARQLAAMGDRVDVYTRRDRPDLPEVVDWVPGVRVIHVPAGPPTEVPKEELLPYMGAFTAFMLRRLQKDPVDLVHANFFYSCLVACEIKEALAIPFVITFHALGRVRRQFHGARDAFPDERFAIEDRIVAVSRTFTHSGSTPIVNALKLQRPVTGDVPLMKLSPFTSKARRL